MYIDFMKNRSKKTKICASQWDYGLRLNIRNIKAAEAHFAVNESADNAAVVPLKEEGDVLTADVPDRFLRQHENVNVYLYEKAEQYGKTVAEIVIEIEPRQKPEDYIDTPEERKRFEVLEEEISGIKESVNTVRTEFQNQQGIIADFTFESMSIGNSVTEGSVVNMDCAYFGADAKASLYWDGRSSGGIGYITKKDGRKCICFGSKNVNSFSWLKVTREDSYPLLTGLDNFTVSYDCYSEGWYTGAWAFYICPHDNPQDPSIKDYIGIMDYPDQVHVERAKDEYYIMPAGLYYGWHHVDAVFRPHGTEIYVNGVHRHTMYNTISPANLLKGNSVFYIGRANWSDNGERFVGYMSSFRVYNRALTKEEIIKNYEANTIAAVSNEDE